MPGPNRKTASIRMLGGVALLGLGLFALPGDLNVRPVEVESPVAAAVDEPSSPATFKVTLPQAAIPEPLGPAVTVDETAYVVEETQFGRRMFDPAKGEIIVETAAGVVAYPDTVDTASLAPDGRAVQELQSTPLPVPNGATLVESQFDGTQWVAVIEDGDRTVAEVESFYREAFGASYELDGDMSDGAVSFEIVASDGVVGWVGIVDDGHVVRARVVWTG